MSAETAIGTITPIPEKTGLDRRILNYAILRRFSSNFGNHDLILLGRAVSMDQIALVYLSGSLDFSGLGKLSPLQDKVYKALTASENYDKVEGIIACELGVREGNFRRLLGKVYKHLGVRGRGQAVVFRLASEAGTEN